jgi:hypothetical protein
VNDVTAPRNEACPILAKTRLRKLFPTCDYVREKLDARVIDNIVVAPRCRERACPFPVFKSGLCRGYLIDAHAEASTLPSALGTVITPPHGHGYQAQASR